MNVLELLQNIQANWALLSLAFVGGAMWWQGKIWFNNVNNKLDSSSKINNDQHEILLCLKSDNELIKQRLTSVETMITTMSTEVRDQEIKLAVLANEKPKVTRVRKLKTL